MTVPKAVIATKQQLEDRERARREGHLTGTYISLTPEQAKEIVSYFYAPMAKGSTVSKPMRCPECGHEHRLPQPYCSPTCRDRGRGLMRKPDKPLP